MRILTLMLLCAKVVTAQITIQDIQYSNNDASPFAGQVATLQGVVTASAEDGNLGFVFIQQDSVQTWGGIQLKGNADLVDLRVGDLVSATGTVTESWGMTTLDLITQVTVLDTGLIIEPIIVDPDEFTYYHFWDTEQYEGMLIELAYEEDSVVVVRQNADTLGNNFGEYKVGADTALPDTGCRVLAGRVTSNVLSSLDVSYINDSVWIDNSGMMNVPPVIVQPGDAWHAVRGIMTHQDGNMVLCPRNDDDFLPLDYGTSTKDQDEEPRLIIFPNPATDRIAILPRLDVVDELLVQIVSADGKPAYQTHLNFRPGDRVVLPILDLKPGLFVVNVVGTGTCVSGRFIKM